MTFNDLLSKLDFNTIKKIKIICGDVQKEIKTEGKHSWDITDIIDTLPNGKEYYHLEVNSISNDRNALVIEIECWKHDLAYNETGNDFIWEEMWNDENDKYFNRYVHCSNCLHGFIAEGIMKNDKIEWEDLEELSFCHD